jgi:Fe-S oxidoreductase
VTYHDPCNLVRNGGVVEEPRQVLRRAALHVVEMQPNREKNWCCGGGGGMLAMTEYAKRRMEAARKKAEQIKATGAKVVATSCHNCLDQLLEINKHYRLGVEVKLLVELVSNALVVGPRPQGVTEG